MVLGSAFFFLALCLLTFWWATRRSSFGQRHTVIVFAWLCAALAATLVVFTAFPGTRSDGSIMGVTLGGAGAFVMLVWTAALRATAKAGTVDRLEVELRERDLTISRLQAEVDALRAGHDSRPLDQARTYLFRVNTRAAIGSRRIGIVTGDIRRTRCADVWVNSENTDMQMARIQDHSISGLIRYEGAHRDNTGRVVHDTIKEELDAKIAGRRPVPPGTVVLTGSGALEARGVRMIAHVASVQSEPGGGFRQIREIGRCVANVLLAVDGAHGKDPSAVLFPLLGAGDGGGDRRSTIQAMVGAVLDHFAADPSSRVRCAYLLAYTEAELTDCLAALEGRDDISREPAVAPSVRSGG